LFCAQQTEGAYIPFVFVMAERSELSDPPSELLSESRVLFEVAAEDSHFDKGAEIVAQHRIYTGDFPRKGDRLDEYGFQPLGVSGVPEPIWRPGPWMATNVEVYPASPGDANRFLRVILCTCSFAPLPEAQNQWRPLQLFQPAAAAV
jgi:hypothetical protein